ncbi:MAG: SpoIVB peptidase [Lachnospiraceae bacterium]|nr:SpoIVB peptidase [Lachnospiraceae bacterium]
MEYPENEIREQPDNKRKKGRMGAVRKGDILFYTVPKTEAEEAKTKKRYKCILTWCAVISFLFLIAFGYWRMWNMIPDKVRILVNETEQFDLNVPLMADFSQENVGVLSVNDSNIPAGSLHINLRDKFTLRAEQTGSYKLNVKLFGFIQLKQVSLDVLNNIEVIPCGNPIGITIKTKGALVLGTGVVATESGNVEPASTVLMTGDYIIAVNRVEIDGKEELIKAIQSAAQDRLILTVLREKEQFEVQVKRVRTAAGDYKIGVWVRDDTQGIGTLTFITTNGRYAALGHGISDVDTGILMAAAGGDIYDAEILSVTKGKAGTPGELTGVIRKSESTRLGSVVANTTRGVFGKLAVENGVGERLEKMSKYGVVELGLRQEVKTGPATILCQVDDAVREYSIEIEHVDYTNAKQSKGLVVHITDEELIEKTGGIVQGMSGSPILQDGKLIGAVTHVFVRDATRGYGTFIENMLEFPE